MKANEFVKKFGWDLAKELADECPSYCNYMHEHGFYKISETWQLNEKHVLVLDLKRLVESHEFINERGGLEHVKNLIATKLHWFDVDAIIKTNQAIFDVESCQ